MDLGYKEQAEDEKHTFSEVFSFFVLILTKEQTIYL